MARGLGINTIAAAKFEATAGIVPASGGWKRLPFVKHSMGEERGLIESNLLGYGRNGLDPTQDVANNRGSITVPVDFRAFGEWLKLMFGAATVSGGVAAQGSVSFQGQPSPNSTITIGTTVFTFVNGAATGLQISIAASLGQTITNLVTGVLANAPSIVFDMVTGEAITISAAASGLLGNTIALAASTAPSSNATVSASTLLGGLNRHVFRSGAPVLPSLALEFGNPEVPNYSTHYGCRADTMKIALARSGLLDCDIDLIAIGETPGASTSAIGTPVPIEVTRFAQATGYLSRNGVPLGTIVSADLMISNGLDPVEVIKADGRILDSDPGMFAAKGSFAARFADRVLYDQARNGLPMDLSFGWSSGNTSLLFNFPRVFLPVPKRPVDGPKGIMTTFAWEASGSPVQSCVVTLTNDVPSYA